ncbi:hypothetical protein ACFLVW_02465 [Chloroflexota bacterium]
MQENQKRRKTEDADIKEEYQTTAFTRKVLEVAAKAESEGRPKRDRLTDEERAAVIRIGLTS